MVPSCVFQLSGEPVIYQEAVPVLTHLSHLTHTTHSTQGSYNYNYNYYLQVSYLSSGNQKLERPCGGPHAVVHNPHSSLVPHVSNHVAFAPRTSSTLLKKPSVRANGDVLKRSRVQTGYELSQDLLDKQIEMLERKYGGERARVAALTIQRAFRRYTLLKKFDAITAMAKAERRLSRRLQDDSQDLTVRSAPLRSLSLRERRPLDSTPSHPQFPHSQHSQLPRSLSGCCELPSVEYYTPTGLQPCMHHGAQVAQATHAGQTGQHFTTYQGHSTHPAHSSHFSPYTPQEAFTEANHPLSHTPLCSYLSHSAYRRSSPGPCVTCGPCGPCATGHSPNELLRPSSAGSASSVTSISANRKVPPEVPKRTSSISCRGTPEVAVRHNLARTADSASLSSVQSSGSDSSHELATETRGSPVWKRKTQGAGSPDHGSNEHASLAQHSEHSANAYHQVQESSVSDSQHTLYKASEAARKRQYRVGLNLFNKKPERGVTYLMKRGFLSNSAQAVASFLVTRKGLSRQMIGEYLGNLQCSFNMDVLHCFAGELDLSGMQVDVALRKFQTYFRMPGEAQKIERLMEVFSQRYCACNRDVVARLRSPETVFVLAFAIIMLNTDLHTPNLKPERRMKLEDFIKNLRGIDDCGDIDRDMLVGIYERVKASEFKPGNDHVTQVLKVQSTIVGKKPNLALPHRRLVCYCRLYEIPDVMKKERPGVHQREVFLFNDLLVVTKILSKKKNSVTYTFRESFPLCGVVVHTFELPHYQYGMKLVQRVDGKVLVTFNARNEHDRSKFAEDLRESISEMDEMENLRIEQELERQKSSRSRAPNSGTNSDNRDSGVADVDLCTPVCGTAVQPEEGAPAMLEPQLKRSALSNSLLDIHDQCEKPQQRRGSVGSLDSGMSISFQSTCTSTVSRDSSPQNLHGQNKPKVSHQPSFLGGLFAKRERKTSRASQDEVPTTTATPAPTPRTTQV